MYHKRYEREDDDDYLAITSPPSGLITLSPNTPILHFNPFGYNTFGSDIGDGHLKINEPQYSHSCSIQSLDIKHNEYDDDDDHYDDIFGEEDELYTKFGIIYRKFCFSSIGIQFTIFLNVIMILINTALIIYEIILMIKSDSFTSYYNLQLPIIYSLFDILLTLILLIEIGLHLIAIYKCHICNYFKYNNDHKIDILVFFLSLFLCILYIFDVFGISDMDNIGFLILRIIRDIMRFVRCIIFAKFLYDEVIMFITETPRKQKKNKKKRNISLSSSCSTGWDHLKTPKQHQFVCL